MNWAGNSFRAIVMFQHSIIWPQVAWSIHCNVRSVHWLPFFLRIKYIVRRWKEKIYWLQNSGWCTRRCPPRSSVMWWSAVGPILQASIFSKMCVFFTMWLEHSYILWAECFISARRRSRSFDTKLSSWGNKSYVSIYSCIKPNVIIIKYIKLIAHCERRWRTSLCHVLRRSQPQ